MTHKTSNSDIAGRMADLTYSLLDKCQIKQKRMAEELGLTVAEFKLMLSVRGDKYVTVSELAKRLELSNSRLTRIIDGLVKKKLIHRNPSSEDRRVMEISLAPAGEKIQQTLNRTYVRTHQDILDLLPAGGAESVILAMAKLEEAMKRWVVKRP